MLNSQHPTHSARWRRWVWCVALVLVSLAPAVARQESSSNAWSWGFGVVSWGRGAGRWELGIGSWAPGVLRAHDPISTKVTWTREISAIFERRCVSCHRPDGYASFPLTTYDEARPWAVAIKEEVLAGGMPPWGAAPGIGHFRNDRRPTRHEQEIIAAWVDGGAPYSPEARTPAFLNAIAPSPTPASQSPAFNAESPAFNSQFPSPSSEETPPGSEVPAPDARVPAPGSAPAVPKAIAWTPPTGGVAIPLAPATVTEAGERTASVTVNLPPDMIMTAWTFEPGAAASVERADLDLGSTWLGTWTAGEASIEFPDDTGAPLNGSATFTARIAYRAPEAPVVDRSHLRVWMTKGARPKTVREATVVRSWRTVAPIDLFAIRPAREAGDVEVIARFANGRAEALGLLHAPSRGPHPTYRLMRPLALPAGARVETTAPVRLLYSAGATRTVKPNVRRRPRR